MPSLKTYAERTELPRQRKWDGVYEQARRLAERAKASGADLASARSTDLLPALTAALDREAAHRKQFRAERRVWVAGNGGSGYEPNMGPIDEANRPKPDFGKIWDLVDGKNVEVDFRGYLENQINQTAQMVSAGKCREIIEGTAAGQFHVHFTQLQYRVCDHSQLSDAINTSNYNNRTIPNCYAQACFTKAFLSEVWNLDSAVIATRNDGACLGVIVNENWAGDRYPEQLVFWRVRMDHQYPGHIFDPYMKNKHKKNYIPESWKNEEGLILF